MKPTQHVSSGVMKGFVHNPRIILLVSIFVILPMRASAVDVTCAKVRYAFSSKGLQDYGSESSAKGKYLPLINYNRLCYYLQKMTVRLIIVGKGIIKIAICLPAGFAMNLIF